MSFNLDAVLHESTRAPFEFTANGRQYRLPHVEDLTLGQRRDIDRGFMFDVVEGIAKVSDGDGGWADAGPEVRDLILSLEADRLVPLQGAWLAHAGLQPGESKASSR